MFTALFTATGRAALALVAGTIFFALLLAAPATASPSEPAVSRAPLPPLAAPAPALEGAHALRLAQGMNWIKKQGGGKGKAGHKGNKSFGGKTYNHNQNQHDKSAASNGFGGSKGAGAIRKFDQNGDGKLSHAEWHKGAASFAFIDENKDGFLTADEISSAPARKAKILNAPPVTVWADDDEKSLTVQEATEITAASKDEPVAAVPPTITDITAILDEQKLADPQLAEKLRAAAAAEPPAGESSAKLALFYRARGKAAGTIGETEQEIADLRKAVELAKKTGGRKLPNIMTDLAAALGRQGSNKEMVAIRKEALALSRSMRKTKGFQVKTLANMIPVFINLGRVRDATKLMAQIEQLLGRSKRIAPADKWRYEWFPRALLAKASLLEAQGRYDKAETLLRAGVRLNEVAIKRKIGAEYGEGYRDTMRRALAKNLLRQGRIVEAEIEARGALLDVLSRVGKYSNETAPNLLVFTTILFEQGRTEEAAQLAEAAIDILEKLGLKESSGAMIRARRALAQAKVQEGDIEGGLALYDKIAEAARKYRWIYRTQMLNDREWMLALVLGGRQKEAIEVLTESLELQKKKNGKQNKLAQAMLAMALARDGDRARALKLFEKSIPKIVKVSDSQEDEDYTLGTSREHRVKAILESYLGLLADLIQSADDEEMKRGYMARSFTIADLARGRSVQRAVSAAAARANVGDPELAELVRSEQDTRKRITAQSALLADALSLPTDQQDPESVEGLRQSVETLRAAAEALTQEIEKRFPDYAKVLKPEAPDPEKVRAVLRKGEAYVSIYVGRDRTYLWGVPQEGDVVFATSPLTADRAAKTVEALRYSLNPPAETLGDIPDFDTRLSYKLFQDVLEPVRPAWASAKSLLVTVNGALGQLPLSVLTTERFHVESGEGPLFADYRRAPWLARTHAVTVVPSSAALITLRSTPAAAKTRKPFIGFGDPFFNEKQAEDAAKPKPKVVADSGQQAFRSRGLPIRLRAAPATQGILKPTISLLPRLPDTAEEVRSLAVTMAADASKSVLLGRKANEKAVKSTKLADYKVVAFATHGLVPGDLAGLREPALALSAPDVSDIDGDGLLTMTEIMGLRLDADWVILSACNTGTARGAGAEAVSGLGRAFFYAGTRALLVSSWPVETTAARKLTTDLFDRLKKHKNLTRAAALQQAMSALIDEPGLIDKKTGEPVFYYAHPIFWAPFIIVGDGGGAT